MQSSVDAYVYKGGTVTLMSRLPTSVSGEYIQQADISAISMTIYKLEDAGSGTGRTSVSGHTDVSLAPADVIFDTLQTVDMWRTDSTGYNFRHEIDISSTSAFEEFGAYYHVEFRMTPVEGQVIVERFTVVCE